MIDELNNNGDDPRETIEEERLIKSRKLFTTENLLSTKEKQSWSKTANVLLAEDFSFFALDDLESIFDEEMSNKAASNTRTKARLSSIEID